MTIIMATGPEYNMLLILPTVLCSTPPTFTYYSFPKSKLKVASSSIMPIFQIKPICQKYMLLIVLMANVLKGWQCALAIK